MTTFTVDTNEDIVADDGFTSLREAIALANDRDNSENGGSAPDRIEFSLGMKPP